MSPDPILLVGGGIVIRHAVVHPPAAYLARFKRSGGQVLTLEAP